MSTSAPAVNSVTLVGHLTADPVLRELPDGRAVCDMRLAVNDQRDQPLFIDVTTFGAAAAACEKYLAKGRQIAVTGRLIYREWQAPDGTRRSKHAVIGRVRFGARPDGQGTDDDAADSAHNGDDNADF
jgi:single-strand DNA-binding protein